jgi:Flp pilus assembly protein TadB
LIDQLTDHRIAEMGQAIKDRKGTFPDLLQQLAQYLNVRLPFTYGQDDTTANDTFSEFWQENGQAVMQYAFFALIQAAVLVLFTRNWAYLAGGIWLLFLMNALVGRLVNRSLP